MACLKNCWYLAGWSDEVPDGAMLARQIAAFAGEDSPMLAAQTQRIGGADFCSLKPALLPSDKGAVLARRALDDLLSRESGTAMS